MFRNHTSFMPFDEIGSVGEALLEAAGCLCLGNEIEHGVEGRLTAIRRLRRSLPKRRCIEDHAEELISATLRR